MLKNKKIISIIMVATIIMTMAISTSAWRADYVTSNDYLQYMNLQAYVIGALYMDTRDEYDAYADISIEYYRHYDLSVTVTITPYNTQSFSPVSATNSYSTEGRDSFDTYCLVDVGPVHQINASTATGTHTSHAYLPNGRYVEWSGTTYWSKSGN